MFNLPQKSWFKVEEIFNQAVLKPDSEQITFVTQACGNDTELFGEVFSLLEADKISEAIFEDSVFPFVAQLLDEDFTKLLKKKVFAGYKLKKLLGRGGMSAVFLAEDPELERDVALKILSSNIDNKFQSILRFRQEAKAASAISHPNIAHIYDFGLHEGSYFLVMEYVEGKSLREMIKTNKITLQNSVEIALQMCRAIHAIHKLGITHRDIKPENVIINDDGLVKVLDFGLAKLTNRTNSNADASLKTLPGLIIGTPAYMSPEQIRGSEIDARTDLWSLGVIIYELLRGARPFQGKTASDIQAAILLENPEPLPLKIELPELENIVRKCLAKDPVQRYQSAEEVLCELKTAQRNVYDLTNQSDKTLKKDNFILRFFRKFKN